MAGEKAATGRRERKGLGSSRLKGRVGVGGAGPRARWRGGNKLVGDCFKNPKNDEDPEWREWKVEEGGRVTCGLS